MENMNDDPRIDPRIKAVMGSMPPDAQGDVNTRQELLQEAMFWFNGSGHSNKRQ